MTGEQKLEVVRTCQSDVPLPILSGQHIDYENPLQLSVDSTVSLQLDLTTNTNTLGHQDMIYYKLLFS